MQQLRSALFALPFLTPLLAQTDWTQLAPATSPIAFTAHAMAYHLPTDRTVLFGGTYAGIRYNETWLFDGSTWAQATPANVPTARVAHAMAYDEIRGRLVMFGGIPAGGGLLGDTWEWDGANWQQLTPTTAPVARRSFPMTYHPGRGKVVLWGGYSTVDHNDMWEWDGANWSPITTTNSPAARRASDMAYEPVTDSLILFSGYQQTNDTWRFNGTNWVQQFPANSPPARYDHSMVTDTARNRIVLFAGPGASDTWEWDGAVGDWRNRAPATLPSARSDTYLAYDLVREKVLMFGSSATAETWSYAPTTVATINYTGTGCSGALAQTPSLTTNERPWLGETFLLDVIDVPANTIALMAYGLSDTASALGPLPASLAGVGMPGCTLQVDPVIIDAFLASGTTGTWSRPLPNTAGLLGQTIYCQGAALAPGANALELIVSNHAALFLGGK